jgi:hypothetical protein
MLALSVLLLASSAGMAELYIYGRADFATGLGPTAVAQADFNGDGHPDLAIVNYTADTVSILLGNASGTFAAHVDYATGVGPIAVCVADFNKDGKLDLAVANKTDGTVSIFLGNGDGTFKTQAVYSAGPTPLSSIATGDFNGDGWPDLAVTNATNPGTVTILLNNKTGAFPTYTSFTTGNIPMSVAVGDVNGDGFLDLAVANDCGSSSTCPPPPGTIGTVSVLLGTGTGTFNTKVDYPVGFFPQAVVMGDFRRLGILDLAVANMGSNTVSVLLGSSIVRGTFEPKVDYTVGVSPAWLTTRDLNNDGVLDLAVGNEKANTVSVLYGNGDGTFVWQGEYGVGSTPTAVTTGDFNLDGLPDLAVVNSGSNTVSVLLGQGAKGFSSRADTSVGYQPQAVAVGDFNGDGKPDLAVINQAVPSYYSYCSYGTVSVLLGNGDGTFTPPSMSATASTYYGAALPCTDSMPSSIVTGDFNNDGVLDLAVANYNSNSVDIFLGNRDGTFTRGTSLGAWSNPISMVAGYFTANTNLDLAVADWGSNIVSIYLGNGDGTFSTNVPWPGTGVEPSSIVVADFNLDGKPDLAVANYYSQTVTVLLGNGDGTFTTVTTPPATGSGPMAMAVGDFNGDGIPDLAVANQGSNNLTILLGKGNGTFTPTKVSPPTGNQPIAVVAEDINGDGKLDLVVTNQCGSGPTCSPGNICVLLGNGDGTFQPPLFYTVGDSPTFAAVGTFVKDGGRDVVVVNHGSNTISTLLSTPVAALSTASLSASGTEVETSWGPWSVMLTNPGTAQMNLSGILTSGDFAETSTCGTILMPGTNCSASVTFTPTQVGTRNGSLTFTDNAPPGVQTVRLTGTGLASGAHFTPTSLAFGSVKVGTTSAALTVTLSNGGDAPLTISSIATAAPFAQTNTCGSFINAGSNCTISVTFAPTSAIAYTGVLSMRDNAGFGQQDVALSGTGTSSTIAAQAAVVTGIVMAAPSVSAGATSTANSPAAPPSNTVLTTSPTGASIGGTVAASSSEEAGRSASQEMQPRPEPVVTLSTQAVPFGRQRLNSTSAAKTLTLTNTGNALLEVRAISTHAPDFAQTNDCGPSLAAGASCTIRISFAPQKAGHIEGYVDIDAGTQGPHKVLMFGDGTTEASVAQTASPGHQAPGSPSPK